MELSKISKEFEQRWGKYLKTEPFIKRMDKELSDMIVSFLSSKNNFGGDNEQFCKSTKSLIEKLSKVYGVRLSEINFADLGEMTLGGYVSENKSILISNNPNTISPSNRVMLFNTILHELRHAFQNQVLCNLSDDPVLANDFKLSFKYYKRPTDRFIDRAEYFTNFCELDAEIFSYALTEEILNSLIKSGEYDFDVSGLRDCIKKNDKRKNEFQENLRLCEEGKIISLGAKTKSIEAYSNYVRGLFDPNAKKKDLSESKKVVEEFDKLVHSKEFNQMVDVDGFYFDNLVKSIFDGADIFEVVKHLDDPTLQYLNKISNEHFLTSGAVVKQYENLVEQSEQFLNKYNIKYNKNDNGDKLAKVYENAPKIYLEIFKSKNFDESMYKDMNLIRGLDSYAHKPEQKLLKNCEKYVEENVPRDELKTLLEGTIENKNKRKHESFSDFVRYGLDGYAIDFHKEQTFHMFENFLNSVGVKCKNQPFSKIYDKFFDVMPKYVGKLLFKSKLNEKEQEFIRDLQAGVYVDIRLKDFKGVFGGSISKYKLEKLLKDGSSKNPVVELFSKNGITIKDLIENEKDKNINLNEKNKI